MKIFNIPKSAKKGSSVKTGTQRPRNDAHIASTNIKTTFFEAETVSI